MGASEPLIFRNPRLKWEELNKLAKLSQIYPSFEKDQQDCKSDPSLHVFNAQCAFMMVALRMPAFLRHPHGTTHETCK